jgi:hypothetical protein
LNDNWLKRPLGTAIEMLAAIPSIISGMWGLFVFAPLFAEYVQPALKESIGPLPVSGVIFQAARNRVTEPCGCASWDQLEGGRWVRRRWLCNRHEEDAAREKAT